MKENNQLADKGREEKKSLAEVKKFPPSDAEIKQNSIKEEKKWTDADELFKIWNKAKDCVHFKDFKQYIESLQNQKA